MSSRLSYALAVLFFLLAAGLRMIDLSLLPPGLSASEVTEIRMAETARQGRVEVFYNIQGKGYEALYPVLLAAFTSISGAGLIGYRMLSVFTGMITLALLYALARRLYGALAALLALGLFSVSFFPLILARGISRDAFVPLLTVAVLLALSRSLPIYGATGRTEPRPLPFAALGILLGLGLYLHPVSLVLALVSMLLIAYMILSRQSVSRRTLSYTWFMLVVLIVIAMPYLISSLQAPELSGARRLFEEGVGSQSPFEALVASIGGVFIVGEADAAHNLPGRPLFDLVSGLLIVVGIISALRSWRQGRYALPLLALALTVPLALFAGDSPNFSAFAPLLPLLALFFGLGVCSIYYGLPRTSRRLAPLLLFGLLVFNLVWVSNDWFVRWSQDARVGAAYERRLGVLAHYLDQTAGDIPTILCVSELRPRATRPQLTDSQLVSLMMNSVPPQLRHVDCGTGMIFTDGGNLQQVVISAAAGLEVIHPYIRDWLAEGRLDTAAAPNTVVHIMNAAALADQIGEFTTTAPVAFAPETPGGMTVTAPPVRFGGNLTFLGHERTYAGTYRPGDTLTLITYWRVDGVVPHDLHFFTHILSDPAAIAAQNDNISVLPDELRPRDILIQVTFVQLPWNMPNGTYLLSIGAAQRRSGERLPVFDGDQPRGTRIFLGDIQVRN